MPQSPAPALPAPPAARTAGDTAVAIALVIVGTITFALIDGIAKHLGDSYSTAQITWARFAFFLLPLVVALGPRRGLAALRTQRPALQIGRAMMPMVGGIMVVIGTRLMPLAEFTAIVFLMPLLVVGLAVPLLGERVGWHRWAAVAGGFAGVLIVVRPGAGVIDWAAAAPLMVALVGAFYQVGTRLLSRTESAQSMMVYPALCGTVASSAVVPFFWQPPTLWGWALLVASGLLHGTSLVSWTLAFSRAPASTLAPFAYCQLIGAGLIGYLVFGDLPDAATLAGSAVIVAAGLYAYHREQRAARGRPERP